MKDFDAGHVLEGDGDGVEAFLAGDALEVRVESGPLEPLAGGGRVEVAQRVPDNAGRVTGGNLGITALEEAEEHPGVLPLVTGGLLEDAGDLLVAFLAGRLGEEGIAVPGLGLPGEGRQQVLFRSGSLE